VKRAAWLLAGIAIGAYVAQRVSESPEAKRAFDETTKRARDILNSAVAGWREGLAEADQELAQENARATKPTERKTATSKKPKTTQRAATKKS
jgi:hypothetical protein